MSHSYKKNGHGKFSSSDKWFRTQYHKNERRKVNNILKEQNRYGTSTFEPYKEHCCLYGDVCYIDEGIWYEIPSKYILNYDGKDPINNLICIGCHYSENHSHKYDDYVWQKEPSENIIINKVDYSVRYSDKSSWSSDGGQYWSADISEMRRRFEKEVFGTEPSRGKNYSYKYPTNIWEEYVKYRDAANNKEHPIWITRKAWDGKVYGYWSRGPKQATYDYDLMEFLFHRKIIPMSFWSHEDLVSWLRSHEEEIIRKWFKVRLLRK